MHSSSLSFCLFLKRLKSQVKRYFNVFQIYTIEKELRIRALSRIRNNICFSLRNGRARIKVFIVADRSVIAQRSSSFLFPIPLK